uniref:Sulfur compound chelating protein SoxZ n=1 Tax=Candidatus Kentrum sp. MB TaxID=2138164 RepID=A0A450XB13_9GAMM|nr:MAG: sulfur compound chelating protein SoxZ [Candidatus Kentron sp. MB]VFK74576.1 MAG: sulfur compound chelating protein SoxZ [Candidatus Kentron sp. MB]
MAKKARMKAPDEVKAGEAFLIKSRFPHPMETGRRKDKKTGETVPRKMVERIEVTFGGKPILTAKLETAISANPYLAFYCRAQDSGELAITWFEDTGKKTTLTKTITVY